MSETNSGVAEEISKLVQTIADNKQHNKDLRKRKRELVDNVIGRDAKRLKLECMNEREKEIKKEIELIKVETDKKIAALNKELLMLNEKRCGMGEHNWIVDPHGDHGEEYCGRCCKMI